MPEGRPRWQCEHRARIDILNLISHQTDAAHFFRVILIAVGVDFQTIIEFPYTLDIVLETAVRKWKHSKQA